ncbi:MAG: F0F1 ATP synthase subunit epsilon [Dehalococcoidia bacterium]|nr:F0F1 ATP synthase subunit epsilon [Dehalococcoidia bacterium]MDZ4247172.1 F0F1 ATP synthase subunit epsilon [Dehalococcoidia bacterium]
MATLKLEIVTAERLVFAGEVNLVLAPGIEGQLGILPHHAPLMTMLIPGELVAKTGTEEFAMCVTGGFLEIRPDKVVILADACEREEEIDLERAEEARKRAEEHLKEATPGVDTARAQAALLRSLTRIKVGERRRRRTHNP